MSVLAIAIVVGLRASPAAGCWAAPPAEVWSLAPDGTFAIRRDNKLGIIQMFRKKGDAEPIWQAKPTDFNSLFSRTMVSPDFNTIMHVRGNHIVNSINDLVVEIIQKDGTRHLLPASKFVADLLKCRGRESTAPQFTWIQDSSAIGKISNVQFNLTTTWDQRANVQFQSGAVSVTGKKHAVDVLDAKSLQWFSPRWTVPFGVVVTLIMGAFVLLQVRRRRSAALQPQ